MLRYVRTKDTEYGAIIDTEKYKEITGEDCYIPKDEIVKQADTIKELCDEYVYHLKGGGKFIDEKLVTSFVYKEIYGAIWTDKGLIYVAKKNDKGELELL